MSRTRTFGLIDDGLLPGAKQRDQSVTSDWEILREPIAGVQVREVRHVPKANGYVTELFRRDWKLDEGVVDQVFQVTLEARAISAWHVHRDTIDRLFASHGSLNIVLYDARRKSPTHGRVNEIRLGTARPGLVVVPPGVWHGVQNTGSTPAMLVNIVDRAYEYESPDHWSLPADTDQIPYRFLAPDDGR